MTLAEGKRKVYMLLDEFSSGGGITEDQDIENKMADFFDTAQKIAAQKQPVKKIYPLELEPGVMEYSMPTDFHRLSAVWRGGQRSSRYLWRGGKILIPLGDTEPVEIEYCAMPATIGPETEDTYTFEVSPAACEALPYFVASQQLITDLVIDYAGLYAIWEELLNVLPSEQTGVGPIRNALFRGR